MGIWIQTANYCISVSKINESINIFFKCVNLNVQSIGISRTIEVITFVFLFRQSTTCVHSFTSASTCAWSCYVTSLVILYHHRIAFPELTPELANVVVKEIQWTSLCPCETGGGPDRKGELFITCTKKIYFTCSFCKPFPNEHNRPFNSSDDN